MWWLLSVIIIFLAIFIFMKRRNNAKNAMKENDDYVVVIDKFGNKKKLYQKEAGLKLVAKFGDFPRLDDIARELSAIGDKDGPATENQKWAVETLEMGSAEKISYNQASALLSARRYSEGIIYRQIGRMNEYPGERYIEAYLVRFIIKDPALTRRVVQWNNRSFARGPGDVPANIYLRNANVDTRYGRTGQRSNHSRYD